MVNNAFEQFEILRLVKIHPFGNLDISITNSTLFMLIAFMVLYVLYRTNTKDGLIVPGR